MNHDWNLKATIAPGGTVLDVVTEPDGRAWLASPAGLFRQDVAQWQTVARAIPFWRINAMMAAGRSLFVAGMPGGLIRSVDGGKTWHRCWIDQTDAPITCLVASPNFHNDKLLLAGTDGDGVLRSKDSGRHWELSNFGLRDFTILALVPAPGWRQREYIFAVTQAGIYQSPNGGRAWRQAGEGLASISIHAVATSSHFEKDKAVYCGDDNGRFFYSIDAGRSWEPLSVMPAAGIINDLHYHPSGDLFAATSNQGILRSTNGGKTWACVQETEAAVLRLANRNGRLYAGLADGLLFSENAGQTWQADPNIAARRFAWLVTATPDIWAAAGPETGIWISADGGGQWQPAGGWPADRLTLALAATQGSFWAAAKDGVYRSADTGGMWTPTGLADEAITILAAVDNTVWAGNRAGHLWQWKRHSWNRCETPFTGQPIVAVALSPHFATDRTVVAAVYCEAEQAIQLWRSDDAGTSWGLWLVEAAAPQNVILSMAGVGGQKTAVALGTEIGQFIEGDGWRRTAVTSKDAPITALLTMSDPDLTLVATTHETMVSFADQAFESSTAGLAGELIVAFKGLASTGSSSLFALSKDGKLFRGIVGSGKRNR